MTTDFESDDLEFAYKLYRGVDDAASRSVLDYLIDHPEQQLEGAHIAAAINAASNRAIARATYTYGELARALGRPRPWREAQSGYLMPEHAAALFRAARKGQYTNES